VKRVCVIFLTMISLNLYIASSASADRVDQLPTGKVASEARKVVRNGGTYSTRWGDCSTYLQRLSQELVERAFRPYGTHEWALYIVNRESGFCPGAVNSSSGTTGLAQFDPPSHPSYDYDRMKRDPAYAVRAFVRLSQGGKYTQPWCLACY